MNTINEKMLETAFKKGYSEGYIDDEGFLLKNIPMEDFSALKKHGMVKQVGQEFKLCSPSIQKAETPQFSFVNKEKVVGKEAYGEDFDEYRFEKEWTAKFSNQFFEDLTQKVGLEIMKDEYREIEINSEPGNFFSSVNVDVEALRSHLEFTAYLGMMDVTAEFLDEHSVEISATVKFGDYHDNIHFKETYSF